MEKQTHPSCHEEGARSKQSKSSSAKTTELHPDHAAQKKRLNRIRGQVDGIERMIDDRRYCVEIIQQIKAAKSALSALESKVMETHLRGCVRSAFAAKDPFDVEEKIQEILGIIG